MRMTQMTYVSADSSTPWGTAVNTSLGTQTTAGKASPKLAEVLPTGQHLVSLNDGITGIKERRATWLKLHAVENELGNECVTVLGYKGLLLAERIILLRTVEVTHRDGTISERLRREQGVGVSVLGNETLGDDPEDLSPNFTNGVHTPVTRLIERLVRRGVDSVVLQKKGLALIRNTYELEHVPRSMGSYGYHSHG